MCIDNWLKYDNFYLAFKRLQTIPRDYYKNLYWNDLYYFGMDINKNINTIISIIKEDLYLPSNSSKIYLPKSTGLVRPISVLTFIDLLVYQSIINILANVFRPSFLPFYNNFVFGNILNNPDNIFFYKNWKDQWKKYEGLTKNYYKNGYVYITEFDLASFYDTIDHYLLKDILEHRNIHCKIIETLLKQLVNWTKDININKERSTRHGIPQGPLGSGFLAEICLHYIDQEMKKHAIENKNIRYMRYVDDIRIFTKTEYKARQIIAYLDLFARNLGLIPQSSKIKVEKVDNIYKYIKTNKNFSKMASEYKANGKLRCSENNKLTRKVIKNLKSKELDKTLLKFSLYRLSASEELKIILLDNKNEILPYFDIICYYLANHFIDDADVIKWVNETIYSEHIIFKYIIAVIFKNFYEIIKFDLTLIKKFYDKSDSWYISYFLLDWVQYHKKDLEFLEDHQNYFVKSKKMFLQYRNIKDLDKKTIFLEDMINSKDDLIGLTGLNFFYEDYFEIPHKVNLKETQNFFIKNIISEYNIAPDDYIVTILKKKGVTSANNFFNKTYFSEEELKRLKNDLKESERNIEFNPDYWIVKMDAFNHLVVKKTIENCGYTIKKHNEYGNLLNIVFLKQNFPITYTNFSKIHDIRGNISHAFKNNKKNSPVNSDSMTVEYKEFKILIDEEFSALKEIVDSFEYIMEVNGVKEQISAGPE